MSETTTRKRLQEIRVPANLTERPRYNGYIVPFFVAWYVGDHQVNENEPGARPSFPTTDFGRMNTCRKFNRCWICGQKMGAFKAFVFGPASAIAGASYEPPSHRDCARYAVQACPFLTDENAKHVLERNENYKLKQGEGVLPEVSPYNPGLAVIYIVRNYQFRMQDRARGIGVFELPSKPESIEFWREGHKATLADVANGIQKAIAANGMMDNSNPTRNRELAWRIKMLMEMAS